VEGGAWARARAARSGANRLRLEGLDNMVMSGCGLLFGDWYYYESSTGNFHLGRSLGSFIIGEAEKIFPAFDSRRLACLYLGMPIFDG